MARGGSTSLWSVHSSTRMALGGTHSSVSRLWRFPTGATSPRGSSVGSGTSSLTRRCSPRRLLRTQMRIKRVLMLRRLRPYVVAVCLALEVTLLLIHLKVLGAVRRVTSKLSAILRVRCPTPFLRVLWILRLKRRKVRVLTRSLSLKGSYSSVRDAWLPGIWRDRLLTVSSEISFDTTSGLRLVSLDSSSAHSLNRTSRLFSTCSARLQRLVRR